MTILSNAWPDLPRPCNTMLTPMASRRGFPPIYHGVLVFGPHHRSPANDAHEFSSAKMGAIVELVEPCRRHGVSLASTFRTRGTQTRFDLQFGGSIKLNAGTMNWRSELSSNQIAVVICVFWFTAIGAWLAFRGCRWWNRGGKQTVQEFMNTAATNISHAQSRLAARRHRRSSAPLNWAQLR
jgi:hypothetical protein